MLNNHIAKPQVATSTDLQPCTFFTFVNLDVQGNGETNCDDINLKMSSRSEDLAAGGSHVLVSTCHFLINL